MQLVEKELSRVSPERDMMLTIGVFDGVHLGHKYLLKQLAAYAERENLLKGVVTFRQHPLEVLSSQAEVPFLTTLEQRVALLKKENMDFVIPLSFTGELAGLSARQFISLLKNYLRMHGVVIGTDFALGRNREGSSDTFSALGEEMNFDVTVIPPILDGSEVISSTAIRKALANGDMNKVQNLLGRPFSIQGQVVAGKGRGTKIGFPTANLDIDLKQALPAGGVYATWAYIDDKVYQSVTNIGRCPTFGDNDCIVEVHLLNYHDNLYGREIRINIMERIRYEKRFSTVDELNKQITIDIKQCIDILSSQYGS